MRQQQRKRVEVSGRLQGKWQALRQDLDQTAALHFERKVFPLPADYAHHFDGADGEMNNALRVAPIKTDKGETAEAFFKQDADRKLFIEVVW